jgi:hypothetical protein
MRTDPPNAAFIVPSVVGTLILAFVLVGGWAIYAQPEIVQPVADPTGDEG